MKKEDNSPLTEEAFFPEPLSDNTLDLSPRQRRFVLLLVHNEGLKTATACALAAGYSKKSSRVRASLLQNPKHFPLVVKAIEGERRAMVERYRCTAERSSSVLARIRDQASESGNWNAAVAAETRRGQIAGLYIDKKEILTGSIDSMSRDDVEAKLLELKKQYSITASFEEIKDMKKIENKS
jgi:phage terminase small subunit|tara:strand:+ start:125 stop:670 length:546 start_codon:yes stop_codon:yes gene_type:complete